MTGSGVKPGGGGIWAKITSFLKPSEPRTPYRGGEREERAVFGGTNRRSLKRLHGNEGLRQCSAVPCRAVPCRAAIPYQSQQNRRSAGREKPAGGTRSVSVMTAEQSIWPAFQSARAQRDRRAGWRRRRRRTEIGVCHFSPPPPPLHLHHPPPPPPTQHVPHLHSPTTTTHAHSRFLHADTEVSIDSFLLAAYGNEL